jgi:hypothetical protein
MICEAVFFPSLHLRLSIVCLIARQRPPGVGNAVALESDVQFRPFLSKNRCELFPGYFAQIFEFF